ncbi:MAG TPA: PDZ domain-containing protein [Candidatus Thermoplasmatota archaeon]|nr:PDZ domain-containing protein [Candidatus Thermoplasmatota archaeon]
MAQVRVTFDVRRPETHLVRVTQRFPGTLGADRTLRMPAWVPGSYKIRDFGRHVQDLSAKAGGRYLPVEQPTKDSWVLKGVNGRAVEVAFDVYCRELTVDTSHVTSDHAHLFPATLMLYDAASRGLPHRLRLLQPRGWRAWSGLETGRLDGTLEVADSFDHLIDCPIECGPPAAYHVGRFQVRGVTHRHVVWQPPQGADWAKVERAMAATCREAVKVFGAIPYRHYTFLTHVAADYGGGLEHRNSTVLGADPAHLQNEEKVQTRYLPLVAHEFVHTWNVKRILPAAFQPYDLQTEVYTDLLWLFEGFTSYYELPLLHRAKVCGEDEFAKMMAEDLEMYHKALGRRRITVSQASRLTWTLLYQPHEHNVNRNVSYYTKGMWVGLCLEAELRRRTKGKVGVDAVMRHAWRKHGKTGMGVTDDAFPDLVSQATGIDLRRQLNDWTRGTEELPIERSLKTLGIDLKTEWKEPRKNKGLGVEFKPGTPTIARIWEDVPAFKVLQPDDELAAAAGYKWRSDHFHDQVANKKPGDEVEVVVFREGRIRHLQVPLVLLPKDKFTVSFSQKPGQAKRLRQAWIGQGKPKPKGKAAPAKRRLKTKVRLSDRAPPRKRPA